jgi:hypothetical protein
MEVRVMLKILFCIVLVIICSGADAVVVDLSEYFPQTLQPRCWRYEEWGGGYTDDYQQEGYSRDILGLQNNVEYDFVFNFYPVGDDIDDISNYYYRIAVGVNWEEGGIGYGENAFFYVGTDWQIGEWSQWSFTKTFTNLEACSFLIFTTFYRSDTPPPWEGEWETTLYIDSPIPEPSMFFMVLLFAIPPFIKRKQ